MAYILNPLLRQNLQKKQDVFKGSFFIKMEDGSEIDAKELIESIEDILGNLNKKLDVKQSKANSILITNNNGNITPVEGVVMQQEERDKLASLQVNAIPDKIQSDNSYVEASGDTINAFGNKLQSGRFPDTSNSENLLVVGNGSGADSKSNALELTYNGELKAQTDVQVGEHRLTDKLNKSDIYASRGIEIKTINDSNFSINQVEFAGHLLDIPENGSVNASYFASQYNTNEFVFYFPNEISNYIAIEYFFLTGYINLLDMSINTGFNRDIYQNGRYTTTYIITVREFGSNYIRLSYSYTRSDTGLYIKRLRVVSKFKKQFQLSINKTDDKPFGYNPAKGEWQTVESVNLQFTEMPDVETTDLESIQYVGEETDKYKKGHWYKKGERKVFKCYEGYGNYFYYNGKTILVSLETEGGEVTSIDGLIDYIEYVNSAGVNIAISEVTEEFISCSGDGNIIMTINRIQEKDLIINAKWEIVGTWDVNELPDVNDHELGYTLRKDGKVFIVGKDKYAGIYLTEHFCDGAYYYVSFDRSKVFVNRNSTIGQFEYPIVSIDELVPVEKMFGIDDATIEVESYGWFHFRVYDGDGNLLFTSNLIIESETATGSNFHFNRLYYEYYCQNWDEFIYIDDEKTNIYRNNEYGQEFDAYNLEPYFGDSDFRLIDIKSSSIWINGSPYFDNCSKTGKVIGNTSKKWIELKKTLIFSSDRSVNIEESIVNNMIDITIKTKYIKGDNYINSVTVMSKSDYNELTEKEDDKLYFLYEQQ